MAELKSFPPSNKIKPSESLVLSEGFLILAGRDRADYAPGLGYINLAVKVALRVCDVDKSTASRWFYGLTQQRVVSSSTNMKKGSPKTPFFR